ncbi:MAG: hypothetical protein CMP59_00925 [Flavobacteriales bacterium]|nr:hypothetical protein [Flavobacteriales bacterium]
MKSTTILSDSSNTAKHIPKEGVLMDGANHPESQSIGEWSESLYQAEIEKSQESTLAGEAVVHSYGWGFLMISILGVGILAAVIAFYRKRFELLLGVLFNWKLSKQIIRYEKVHSHPVNILLMLAFLIFFPLFFAKIGSELSKYDFIFLWQRILMYLVIYFVVKLILYRFSAWLFDEGSLINKYVFQLNLYSKFMGVLLIGMWILLIYSPIGIDYLFNFSMLILILFLTLQTARAFMIGRSEGKSLYLIILYLCTLEIVPWILIIKSLKNNW